MPQIEEADAAAESIALPDGWDKKQLLWLVDSLYHNPQGYGFPKRWTNAPNWEPDRLLRGISRATWGNNCPPVEWLGFTERWKGLPCDLVREIFLEGRLPHTPFDKKGTTAWLEGLAWANRTRYRNRTLYRDPVHWLWLSTPTSWSLRKHTSYLPRTPHVALWLLNTAKSKAWTKERVAHGPGGQQHTFTYIDLIDEVWDGDIPTIKTSVDKVFARVNERTSEGALQGIFERNQPLAPLPSHWPRLLPGMKHINTGRALVQEGCNMGHCVGGYVDAASRGQSFIFSLHTGAGPSTVELSPSRGVVQHRGKENTEPPRGNETLLRQWLERAS